MARSTNTKSPTRSYARGMDLYRVGQYPQALACLQRVEGTDSLLGTLSSFYAGLCHRALGLAGLQHGHLREAQKHLRQAGRRLGGQAELAGYLAAAYARTGQFDHCAAQLERMAETDPAADTARRLAQAQWRQGRREAAYSTLHAALRRHGGQVDLSIQLALFLAAEDRFDEARPLLEAAVRTDSSRPDAHRYLGFCAAAMGDPVAAAGAFQRVLDLCPTDRSAARQLALAARAAGEAGHRIVLRLCEPGQTGPQSVDIRQFAEYVTGDTDLLDAFCALPPSAIDADLFEMLYGVVQVALTSHPDYADLHYHQARICRRLGRQGRAAFHVHRALAIHPRYVAALLLKADLEAGAGEIDRALIAAGQAVRCGADWPDVHCQLGEWMIRRGHMDQARNHLTRALQLRQGYPRALRALRSLAA